MSGKYKSSFVGNSLSIHFNFTETVAKQIYFVQPDFAVEKFRFFLGRIYNELISNDSEQYQIKNYAD